MALLCDWQEKVKLTEASVVFHLRTGRVDVELVHHCAERGTDLVDFRGPIQQLEASAAACFDLGDGKSQGGEPALFDLIVRHQAGVVVHAVVRRVHQTVEFPAFE